MGLIKKVAALGAVAAVGVLAVNREKVMKAVKGALGKAPTNVKLAAGKTAAKTAAARVKKEPHAKAPRAARRKARRAHRQVATE